MKSSERRDDVSEEALDQAMNSHLRPPPPPGIDSGAYWAPKQHQRELERCTPPAAISCTLVKASFIVSMRWQTIARKDVSANEGVELTP